MVLPNGWNKIDKKDGKTYKKNKKHEKTYITLETETGEVL